MVFPAIPVQENAAAVFWASLYSDNVERRPASVAWRSEAALSTAGVTSVWVYFPVAYFVWEAFPAPRLKERRNTLPAPAAKP